MSYASEVPSLRVLFSPSVVVNQVSVIPVGRHKEVVVLQNFQIVDLQIPWHKICRYDLFKPPVSGPDFVANSNILGPLPPLVCEEPMHGGDFDAPVKQIMVILNSFQRFQNRALG